MKIISIGEVLWDVFPDAEHIGGAAFNFAAHAVRLGAAVRFISAVGADARGVATRRRMRELGVDDRLVPTVTEAPTGAVTVRLEAGQPSYTIHRPAAYDFPPEFAASNEAAADWIYIGTLAQMAPRVRQVTRQVRAAWPQARVFYDLNLRRESYTPELIHELLGEATALKLNHEEARELGPLLGMRSTTPAELAARYGLETVCITRGAEGCELWSGGHAVEVPGVPVSVVDAVGAGDAFAAALVYGLDQHWPLAKVGQMANRLGALVASRAGAVPDWTMTEWQNPPAACGR
jgi:fructokinase